MTAIAIVGSGLVGSGWAIVFAERRQVLPASELAARGAWRDRRLMALAKHKREMAQVAHEPAA